MGIVAIDAGGSTTKFYDGKDMTVFPSEIGYDWRERRIKSQYGQFDYEWEYDGMKGFAGTLAQYESDSSDSRKGDTKAHPDARLRVLLALHQFAEGIGHHIVVGQPIGKHNDTEKVAIKKMLEGRHDFSVNGNRKTIVIHRCEVAAEGVTAGLLVPSTGTIRIIDIGSGTVNFGTLINRRLNDKGSFTLSTGVETKLSDDTTAFARQIALRAIKGGWKEDDNIFLCGGGATTHLSDIKTYFKKTCLIDSDPVTANVKAFYLIAGRLYG